MNNEFTTLDYIIIKRIPKHKIINFLQSILDSKANSSCVDTIDYEKLIYFYISYSEDPNIRDLCMRVFHKINNDYKLKQKYLIKYSDENV